VGYNAGYPYSAVAELQVTFPDHKSYVGSGAMIDSFHVLTAAHMLYSASDGGWATSIKVTPDMYYNNAPRGVAWGTYERVDPSWIPWSQGHPGQTSPSVEDIGLVTLNSKIGNYTGWFGFGYNNNNNSFTNQYFETAGYPASYGYNGQQMYYSFGRITGEVGYDLVSTEGNITIVPGQSGSPLWNTSTNVIYGVVSGYDGNTNYNTQDYFARITSAVFNELQSWRNSDRAPSAASAAFAMLPGGLNSDAGLVQATVRVPQSPAAGSRIMVSAGTPVLRITASVPQNSATTSSVVSFLLTGTPRKDASHADAVDTLFAPLGAPDFGALSLA
jgi:V8-like Glu-specific endopeptidase